MSCVASIVSFVACVALFALTPRSLVAAAAAGLDEIKAGFHRPTGAARIRVLDAIPRGGWNMERLVRDLQLMQEAGFGGLAYLDGYEGHGQVFGDITVFPEADRQSEPFLSAEHRRKLNHLLEEAQQRDLRVLAPIRALYFSGGPWITQDLAQKEYTFSKTYVTGGQQLRLQLPQPPSRDADAVPEADKKTYYRDAYVVAWPVQPDPRQTAMHRLKPTITVSNHESHAERAYLVDGDGFSAMRLHGAWLLPAGPRPATMPAPTTIDFTFAEPLNAVACFVKLSPDRSASRVRGSISSSTDGQEYRKLVDFEVMMGREERLRLPGGASTKWYRVEFAAITNRDSVGVAEIEFLAPGEEPVTRERIRNFGQKSNRACWEESLVTEPAEYFGSRFFYESADAVARDDVVRRADVLDLTPHLRGNTLEWDAPPGTWCVMRFGYTIGKHAYTVARHGGAGYECDLFNADAARLQFEQVPQRILDALSPEGRKALQGFWFESLETGQSNWTPRMPEEFRRIAGYELASWLPVLADQVVDGPHESDAFLADFRRTLNLLFAENHHGTLKQLCENNGLEWVSETGGSRQSGLDALQYLSRASVSMGEFWGGNAVVGYGPTLFEFHGRRGATGAAPWWSIDAQVKLPASVSHTYGNSPLVAMEALTGADFTFHRVPAFDKHVTDRAFCSGANQLYLSWWPNDSRPDALPGLHHWGWVTPRNTVFRQSAAFFEYVSRCQSLLQRGWFQADIVIAQEGAFHLHERSGSQTDPKVFVPRGHDFDFLSRELFLDDLTVIDGSLALSSGMKYRVLQVPDLANRMSLEYVRKIEALLQAGAVIVAPKPEAGMSARDYAEGRSEHRERIDRIWSGLDGTTQTWKPLGKGRLYWGMPLAEVLRRENVRPDFVYETAGAAAYVDHIHRRIDASGVDVYFLANAVNESAEILARFRNQGAKSAYVFDPLSGEVRAIPQHRNLENGDVEIPLRLEAVGSLFVVFTETEPGAAIRSIAGPTGVQFRNDERGRAVAEVKQNGSYRFTDDRGRNAHIHVERLPPAVAVAGPWRVDFADKFGERFSREFVGLRSFSEHDDPEVKFFSGEATYQSRFVLPSTPHTRWQLELGEVRWLAEIKINGRKAGTVWCPPWRLDVTEFCRPGENTLEITCANPWRNRLIGDAQLPEHERKTVVTNFRTVLADFRTLPLMEAGLLGPVRLVPTEVAQLKF